MADLGGGSLELVMIENGACHDGVSLPLGTLRLPSAARDKARRAFRKAIEREMARAGWAAEHPGPLYMVGGTWRALATFALRRDEHPLTDPHRADDDGVEEADALAKKVARLEPAELAAIPGVDHPRAGGLARRARPCCGSCWPICTPDGLVFSSWGLREGPAVRAASAPSARAQDPLLAAVAHFCEPRGGSPSQAAMMAAWTARISPTAPARQDERLRLAATMLALAAAHVEPNLRARTRYDWAMDKRWLGSRS